MSRKGIRKMKSFAKKRGSPLKPHQPRWTQNYVAVSEDFADGIGTSRSIWYPERNTSREGEVSRKVIKRKNEIICKKNVAHLCSRVTPTGPNYAAVRGYFAAGTGNCCENWGKYKQKKRGE